MKSLDTLRLNVNVQNPKDRVPAAKLEWSDFHQMIIPCRRQPQDHINIVVMRIQDASS